MKSLGDTLRINEKNHLTIDSVDVCKLAQQYGTPLYIYEVNKLRERARSFHQAFQTEGVSYKIAYASKAFSCIAMAQVVEEEGFHLDVVSNGELYTALSAMFPRERIHFHGNNKSRCELETAVREKIGCIVVDNFYELNLLEEIAATHNTVMPILLRITPGVEAHTHQHIQTGQQDSKFGFDLGSLQAEEAVKRALLKKHVHLLGVHFHIGSQIFDSAGFCTAIQKVFPHMIKWKEQYEYTVKVLNVGGGFGISYVDTDTPTPISQQLHDIIQEVKRISTASNYPLPEIWIEPGRSLVGDSGYTLYEVGTQKNIPNVRHYVAVNGGMSDNLRPALYGAKYKACLANRMNEAHDTVVSIAGKCCETGDMIIWDAHLPPPQAGDYVLVFSTGAYGYAMSNNYNRIPRPAVVFVENGQSKLVIKRETHEDLLKNDLPYK